MNAKKRKRNDEDGLNTVPEHTRAQIGVQFRELKEQLASVTEDEWASIPEVGDHRYAHTRARC